MSKSLGQFVAEAVVCPVLLLLPDSAPKPTPEERIADALEEIADRDSD